IALVARGFEIRDVAKVEQIKATVGDHEFSSGGAKGRSPFGQLPAGDDLVPEIHRRSLAESSPGNQFAKWPTRRMVLASVPARFPGAFLREGEAGCMKSGGAKLCRAESARNPSTRLGRASPHLGGLLLMQQHAIRAVARHGPAGVRVGH